MDNRDRQATTLRENAARKATAKREAVQHALIELHNSNEPVSFASVARAAKVSRTYLYTTPDLAEQIRTLIAQHGHPRRSQVIGALRILRPSTQDGPDQNTVEALQSQVEHLEAQLTACQDELDQLRREHDRCPKEH